MGSSVSRSYTCCSFRDKRGAGDGFLVDRPPQFECLEVEVQLEHPVMVAFAPLHQREVLNQRRLALASRHEVNIYRLPDNDLSPGEPPRLVLTHVLKLDPRHVVTAILFSDEDNSRNFAVAISPENGGHLEERFVRVWSADAPGAWLPSGTDTPRSSPVSPSDAPGPGQRPVELRQSQGFVAGLGEHKAPVTRMATNKTYLLTADDAGECRLWQKTRAFTKRAVALLHAGGVSDLAVDRLFAYSAGQEDRRICAWALPDLSPVLAIPVDIPEEMLVGLVPSSSRLVADVAAGAALERVSAASGPGAPTQRQAGRLARVNLLRRPLSRWAGWQGSSRGPKAPRGSLFAAGVLREGCEVAGAGAGVLMEWTMGEKPSCQSVQIAHDSPIVSLVYGPYDNGPLISADAKGVFRVWEFLLERGLCFTQQIELVCIASPGGGPLCPAMAVEQPRGLYVAAGSKRIFVWQRYQDANGRP